jgi:hypothetical protein
LVHAFPYFGILYQDKSGNPVWDTRARGDIHSRILPTPMTAVSGADIANFIQLKFVKQTKH